VPPVARHGAGQQGEKPRGRRTSTWQGKAAAQSYRAGADRRGTCSQLELIDWPRQMTNCGLIARPVRHEGTIVGHWACYPGQLRDFLGQLGDRQCKLDFACLAQSY